MDRVVDIRLTDQQAAIVHSEGDIVVQAFAGTGKSTTAMYLAREMQRPGQYLCFNRSNRFRFAQHCQHEQIKNLKVDTIHSMAKGLVYGTRSVELGTLSYVKLKQVLFDDKELVSNVPVFQIVHHVLNLLTLFFNSTDRKINSFTYTIPDSDPCHLLHPLIFDKATLLMRLMEEVKIPIMHDYYLKKAFLREVKVPGDFIIVDEAQDISPVVLEILLRQKARKVIIGDTHQQIYSWRGAINAMERVPFKVHYLSESFRFGPIVSKVCNAVLDWKRELYPEVPEIKPITGCGPSSGAVGQAVVSRTTAQLIAAGLEFVNQHGVKRIRFEGSIESYFRHEQGITIRDVYNLYFDNTDALKRSAINTYPTFDHFQQFVENTEDGVLASFIEIVKKYGTDTMRLLKILQDSHVSEEDAHKAEVSFTTAHKSKGLEFKEIYVEPDFHNISQLQRTVSNTPPDELTKAEILEEVNVLYVACSRASNTLQIPDSILDTLNIR